MEERTYYRGWLGACALPGLALLFVALAATPAFSQALSITTACPLPPGGAGVTYSVQFTAEGGVPPYRWGVLADAGFPSGFVLRPETGEYTGSTTRVGTFGFLITLSDSASGFTTKRCSLPIYTVIEGYGRYVPSVTAITRIVAESNRRRFTLPVEVKASSTATGASIAIAMVAVASTNSGVAWLTVSADRSITPVNLTVDIDPTVLDEGEHRGAITITSPDGLGRQLTIPVTVTVTQPGLTISSNPVILDLRLGGSVSSKAVSVTSTISDTQLAFRFDKQAACSWLKVSPESGVTPASVSFQPNTAVAGTYSCVVHLSSVNGPGQTLAVPVNAIIRPQPPLLVRPQSLVFDYEIDSSVPSPKQLTVAGLGNNFVVDTSEVGTAHWFKVDSSSGTTPSVLTVSVEPESLAAGTYSAAVKIVATGPIHDEQRIPIALRVLRGQSLEVTPNLLEVEVDEHSTDPVENLVLLNSTSAPASYQAAFGDWWLAASPPRGSTGTLDTDTQTYLSRPAVVRLLFDPRGLRSGLYRGYLSLSGNLDTPDRLDRSGVNVSLRVRAGPVVAPLVLDGGGFRTTLYLANNASAGATYTVQFFKPGGGELPLATNGNPPAAAFSGSIGPGAVAVLETAGGPSSITSGWALVQASTPLTVNALLRFRKSDGKTILVSSTSDPRPSRVWWLPWGATGGANRGLMLLNPNPVVAEVEITYRDPFGKTVASGSVSLPAGVQRFLQVADPPAPAFPGGTLQVASAVSPIVVLGITPGTETAYQAVVPALSSGSGSVGTEMVFPEVIDGGSLATEFTLVNPSGEPARAAILLRRRSSLFLDASFDDFEDLPELTETIPPFGSIVARTKGTGPSDPDGWSHVWSSSPILAYASMPSARTALPFYSTGVNFLFPFDNLEGGVTSVRLFNPDEEQTAAVTVVLRDESARIIQSSIEILAPQARRVMNVGTAFSLSAELRGSIEIRYNQAPGYATASYSIDGSTVSLVPRRR